MVLTGTDALPLDTSRASLQRVTRHTLVDVYHIVILAGSRLRRLIGVANDTAGDTHEVSLQSPLLEKRLTLLQLEDTFSCIDPASAET